MPRKTRRVAQVALALLPLILPMALGPAPANASVTTSLHNLRNGLCLDADIASHGGLNPVDRNGMWVQLWSCNGWSNQQWIVDGNYQIRSVRNGLCLDADDSGGLYDGAKVQLWSCNGQSNQTWVTNGSCYCYITPWGHKALDADINSHGGTNPVDQNGMRVQVWGWGGGSNQKWTFR